MTTIFELYDNITMHRVSLHKTLIGALKALTIEVDRLSLPLARDYDDAKEVDFEISYQIRTLGVKE